MLTPRKTAILYSNPTIFLKKGIRSYIQSNDEELSMGERH
jgi:hypothetical protein